MEDKCAKVPARVYLKKDVLPVFKKARPVPLGIREEVRQELDRLIKNGIIE